MFLPFTLSVAERHIWRFSDEGKGSKNQNSENEVWKIIARTEIERRYTVKKWERWGSEGQGDRETSPHSPAGKEQSGKLSQEWSKDRDSQQQAVQAEPGRNWNKGKERTNLFPFWLLCLCKYMCIHVLVVDGSWCHLPFSDGTYGSPWS